MSALTNRKLVVVTRKTRLEELVPRYHSVAQAKFYLEHLGADFGDYQREHETYLAAKAKTMQAVAQFLRRQVIDRQILPNFVFGADDIVLALGQDGLVANTMKYLDGQPLLGVNPDPKRYDGILLPFGVDEIDSILREAAEDKRPAKTITMAKAILSDQQTLYAVNDFFVGPRTHTSARYEIRLGERQETQSSSGIIISTGLGSTAWMKSVVTGARAIATGVHQNTKISAAAYEPLPWGTDHLLFAVREPFPSRATQASLVFGTIATGSALLVRSLMPEGGVLFSDGIEADFLHFNSGTEAKIGVADRRGVLIQ